MRSRPTLAQRMRENHKKVHWVEQICLKAYLLIVACVENVRRCGRSPSGVRNSQLFGEVLFFECLTNAAQLHEVRASQISTFNIISLFWSVQSSVNLIATRTDGCHQSRFYRKLDGN